MVEQALRMPGESVLIEDFNLYHATWGGPSYPRQYVLSDDLIDIVTRAGAALALPQDTITRDYQRSQTTIDLVFTIDDIFK